MAHLISRMQAKVNDDSPTHRFPTPSATTGWMEERRLARTRAASIAQ
ncbi:MAG: hypothetical protein HY298_25395 [Verrucomicrobia bacterium]|nr:hypothetical protein [Verrucomicrobiota bacterium]